MIAEENKIEVDMEGYNKAKKHAQEMSKAGKKAIGGIELDVNAIGELQAKNVAGTDDRWAL